MKTVCNVLCLETLAVFGALALAPVVRGQTTTEPATSAPAVAAVRLADVPYVDASFGFSFRPFHDCQIVRQKRLDAEGNLELAQFVNLGRDWMLTVYLPQESSSATPDEALEDFETRLTRRDPEARPLRKEKLTVRGRDVAWAAGSLSVGKGQWFRQEATVFARADTRVVLAFDVPLSQRTAAEALFRDVIGSFEVLRSEAVQKRIDDALVRSAEFLASLGRGGKLAPDLIKEAYLRILINGKDTGYLWMRESRGTFERREGVGIRHEGWMFESDGTVKRQLSEMFLSDDLTFEKWNTVGEIVIPARAGAPLQKLTTYEQGLREDRQILVAFTESPNATNAKERTIEAPEAYAPLALFTLFPRLIDRNKPELYAFIGYNGDRRGLILRTLRVVGPQNVTIDGRMRRATRIEDSEGLLPPISEMYVDDKGQVVKMVAGDVEMLAAGEERISSLYRARVEATLKAVTEMEKAILEREKASKGRSDRAQPPAGNKPAERRDRQGGL